MDFHKIFGFLEILRESFKTISRNGRLMAFITTLYLLLSSLLFFLFIHSTKPLVYDLLKKEIDLSSANPPEHLVLAELLVAIQNDITTLLTIDLAFPIAFFLLSLFIQTATILVSAMSYKEKNFSFKDLLMRVLRSWRRPFVTSFHVTLYVIGFTFFAFAMIIVPPLMIYNHTYASHTLYYLLSFLAVVFYLNFSVVWVLALVISVIEEGCGVEALGKAGGLVKGKRLHGFILNFLFTLLSVVLICSGRSIIVEKSPLAVQMIFGVLLICANCLGNMFQFTVYTVLYFECKKNYGEEIELPESMEYSKIPSLPLVNESEPASIYKNLFKYYVFRIL